MVRNSLEYFWYNLYNVTYRYFFVRFEKYGSTFYDIKSISHLSLQKKDPNKSRNFAHFNVTSLDIVRAVGEHPRSKIHQRAVGLSEDKDQQLEEPDPRCIGPVS